MLGCQPASHVCVGSGNKQDWEDENNGEPDGPSGDTKYPGSIEFRNAAEAFTSATGKGVHDKSAHKVWYDKEKESKSTKYAALLPS